MSDLVQNWIEGRTAVKVAAGLERAIEAGRLRPGDRLPTVRALAAELGLSPATVASAYKTLRRRGWIVGEGRRGTRVRERPGLASRAAPPLPDGVRNLADGNPDAALLPDLGPVLRGLDASQRLYGEAANLPELVEVGRSLLHDPEAPDGDVALVSGALDGIERILQARLLPGDRVGVEDPGYADVIDLVRAMGLVPVAIPVDDRGPTTDGLAEALTRDVQAIVVTPRAQNPFGAAIDADRAAALRRLLDDHPDVLRIEDDHAGPIGGRKPPTLRTNAAVHWAVLHSVSKSLGPDLRLAFLMGDAATVARVEGRQRLGVGWVSRLLQQVVRVLLEDPATPRTFGKAARTYDERRKALQRALTDHGIRAHGASGLNLWVPTTDETLTLQSLLDAGWAVAPGERFRVQTAPAIRITTATLQAAEAKRLAADLAAFLRSHRRTHVA